jgi:hypothetical protein
MGECVDLGVTDDAGATTTTTTTASRVCDLAREVFGVVAMVLERGRAWASGLSVVVVWWRPSLSSSGLVLVVVWCRRDGAIDYP